MAEGEVLADIGVGSSASCVAWCPVNGMVAVGARVSADLACVHLLSVQWVTSKVTLYVPLQGAADGLSAVAWSPAGCRRVLLVATLSGRLTAWAQQPPEPTSQTRITVEDWWLHDVANLSAAAGVAAPPGSVEAAVAEQNGSTNCSNDSVHLVSVRWLEAVPSWVWKRDNVHNGDFQAGMLYDAFAPSSVKQEAGGPDSNDAAAAAAAQQETGNEFHWVRTGTLALAAVLSNGAVVLSWARWSAYGQLQWTTTRGMTLGPERAAVQAADATVCSEGVAVCYTLQQEPGTIHVVQLQGSPLHALWGSLDPTQPVQLPVVPVVANVQPVQGHCISALSWDPASSGTRLVSVTQQHSSNAEAGVAAPADVASEGEAGSGACITLCSVQQGQLVQLGQVECSAAVSQQQMAWLLDSLLVCSGSRGMQLYHLDPVKQVPIGFAAPVSRMAAKAEGSTHGRGSGCALRALAASPHGTAVAAVLECAQVAPGLSSSRLLLYNVPSCSKRSSTRSDSPVKAAAWRLLWALQHQKHTWDVVQHVLCIARQPAEDSNGDSNVAAGAAGQVQPSIVGDMLSLVDAKLAVQQPTLKSTYSARWDVLKLGVLAGTPGDDARVVSMDLRMRIICTTVRPVFDILREETALRQREQRPKLQGLAPLQAYLADLMSFNIACLKTWVARRAGTSNAGGQPQHVPCVRHLLDARACNILLLLYMLTATATATTSKADDVLYGCLKLALKAAPSWKDPNWEPTAKALFPGQLQLHYSDAVPETLSSLNLPPEQLMAHMESSAHWQQQVPLADVEICARATRLGLLPARPQKLISMYKRELQLHSNFRLQPPADPATDSATDMPAAAAQPADAPRAGRGGARLVSMKRRRWEQQIHDAMGDVLGAGCSGSKTIMSLAQLAYMDADTPGCLQSVDGAVLVPDGPTPLDDGSKSVPKLIVDQCTYGWIYACPVTGEMWLRTAA